MEEHHGTYIGWLAMEPALWTRICIMAHFVDYAERRWRLIPRIQYACQCLYDEVVDDFALVMQHQPGHYFPPPPPAFHPYHTGPYVNHLSYHLYWMARRPQRVGAWAGPRARTLDKPKPGYVCQ